MLRRLLALAPVAFLASGCMCAWWGDGGHDPSPHVRAQPTLFERSATSADGTPIHALVGGEGDLALVFVHGWLGSAEWWRPVMQRLCGRFRVVAVDLAGHGLSGREREDWSVPRFADDVVSVLDELDLRRVVLVAQGMSGAVAAEVARRLGPRAECLVFADGRDDLAWTPTAEEWTLLPERLRDERFAPPFVGTRSDRAPSPAVARRFVESASIVEPSSAHAMLLRAREFDLAAARSSLALPVRVLHPGVHGASGGVITVRPWGERSFYAEDPWKNPLCFVEAGTVYAG